jgi:heme oxygenase
LLTTPNEPGARSILRSATDDIHQRMHRHPGFALLAAGTIERAAYRRLLARSYGFYVTAERLIERGDDWVCRLVDDLLELGLTDQAIAELPRCPSPAIERDEAARIGATHVLLGASLGGKVMARTVARRASVGDGLPTRFLACDDNESSKVFAAQLDVILPSNGARASAARTAVTFFEAF